MSEPQKAKQSEVLMTRIEAAAFLRLKTQTLAAWAILLKLFKIGAKIRITVRKVRISFAEGYPYRRVFDQALANIAKIPLRV